MLEFSSTSYQITALGSWPTPQLSTDNLKFAPGDAGVAWYVCAPHCELHAFLRDTRSALTVPVPPQFPRNGYLDIGWSKSQPFPQFYWGAQKKEMCLQADGRPALPRGAPPKGTYFPQEPGVEIAPGESAATP